MNLNIRFVKKLRVFLTLSVICLGLILVSIYLIFPVKSFLNEKPKFNSNHNQEYQNGVNNPKLDFGLDDYHCSGTCICEQSTERRIAAATVARKGISFFVAALTSAVAINQAKNLFDKKCEEEYEDTLCSSVSSEVSECVATMASNTKKKKTTSKKKNIARSKDELRIKKKGKKGEEDHGKKGVEYLCKGICVKDIELPENRDGVEKLSIVEKCPEIHLSTVFASEKDNSDPGTGFSDVEYDFMLQRLDPFCKMKSVFKNVMLENGVIRDVTLCRGYSKEWVTKPTKQVTFANENVNCRVHFEETEDAA